MINTYITHTCRSCIFSLCVFSTVFQMFSGKESTKSVLLCGAYDFTRLFTFEAAIHWALEGRHVLFITPTPLDSIPAKYHDRSGLVVESFKLVKFMYLKDYESLMDTLVDLHSHHTPPGILLIDKLDAYVDHPRANDQHLHIARLCAIIHDTMNACCRVSKNQNKTHILASITPRNFDKSSYDLYFDQIWEIKNKDNESISLEPRKCSKEPREVLEYKKFSDGTLILEKILRRFQND